jgi:hypothetical protein
MRLLVQQRLFSSAHCVDSRSWPNSQESQSTEGNKKWNGVSAKNCIPVDWGRLIPPYLHLMLGLVNDKVQRIYKELLALDGIDEEAAQRLSD